jgi:hypothetical protein
LGASPAEPFRETAVGPTYPSGMWPIPPKVGRVIRDQAAAVAVPDTSWADGNPIGSRGLCRATLA